MKVLVKNRAAGTTIYTIPELGDKRNIIRSFAPSEIKEIDDTELEALTFVPGGSQLLKDYLQIMDSDLSEKIIYDKQPEYDMSEEDIKELMLHGSYDAFLDCLDFAPDGVLSLIKQYAVELPLNDRAKCEAILEKLHFNVEKAIQLQKETEADSNEGAKEVKPQTSGRRTNTPKYNVVKKETK